MASDLAGEFVVAALGMDCAVTQAWLEAYMADNAAHAAWARCNIVWDKANEYQRDAIASALGFAEPSDERFPFVAAIADDFRRAADAVWAALDTNA